MFTLEHMKDFTKLKFIDSSYIGGFLVAQW